MKLFGIHFPIDSYKKDGQLDSFGQVHVKLDDYAFPSEVWTDFGLYIISAWAESLVQICKKERKKVQCKFMDGNYRYDISVKDSGKWNFQFVAERETEEVWAEGEVESKQATKTLLSIVDVILNEERRISQPEKAIFWQDIRQKLVEAQNFDT